MFYIWISKVLLCMAGALLFTLAGIAIKEDLVLHKRNENARMVLVLATIGAICLGLALIF